MEKMINLTEIFTSVQGESSFVGYPTVFVRTAACNLRCVWCDTSYSFGKGKQASFDDIISFVHESGCKHICITGGEPLLQEGVFFLMEILCDQGFIVSLETGGSLSTERVDSRVHIILDIKCPGSGMVEKNDYSNLSRLQSKDEVKFVIGDANDYQFAKQICVQYQLYDHCRNVLFSPVFESLESKELVQWILQDKIPVRLNLQVHKFIWDPATKGV